MLAILALALILKLFFEQKKEDMENRVYDLDEFEELIG